MEDLKSRTSEDLETRDVTKSSKATLLKARLISKTNFMTIYRCKCLSSITKYKKYKRVKNGWPGINQVWLYVSEGQHQTELVLCRVDHCQTPNTTTTQ